MTYGEPRGRHVPGAQPAVNDTPARSRPGDETGTWGAGGPEQAGWSWTEPAPDPATTGWDHRQPVADPGYGYPAPDGHQRDRSRAESDRVGYQPGARWPTREPESTGWPQSRETAQWPPAPAPGRDVGPGWPTGAGESPGRPRADRPRERRPGTGPGSRRAAPEPPRGGAWRSYLLIGTLLAMITAGLGGALWKSGWLKSPEIKQPAPRPAPVVPGGSAASTPARPRATGSAAANVPVTVVDKGTGTFTPADSEGRLLGTAGALRRFRVEVEDGINEDSGAFATTIDQVLGDQRSWIASGQLRLQRVPKAAPADFTIFLASPATSESMCAVGGLHTDKFTSCRLPGQVIINDARWLTAVPNYGAPLEVYRAYAINHEVGHELGHGHEACTGAGRLAPVMQQQTLGLKGCVANSWPFVDGQRYAGPPIP
jgi:Protein of unknown function (DUF3152)